MCSRFGPATRNFIVYSARRSRTWRPSACGWHGSHGFLAGRRTSLVRRAVRARQPIVSLQNTLVYPEFARGTLEVLGSLQAKEQDDYRDAEPNILHEIRYGELAHFQLIPDTPW